MRLWMLLACLLLLVPLACESEGGDTEVDLVPVERQSSGTVNLGPEEGFLLVGGIHQDVGVASTRGSDMLVYAASDSLQIKPGEPDGRLVVHKPEGGGRPYHTTSLGEIPYEPPSSSAAAAYLGSPEVGYGFTLLGNGNGAYGRFRVTEAPDAALGADGIRVTLEYDVTWTELVPAD